MFIQPHCDLRTWQLLHQQKAAVFLTSLVVLNCLQILTCLRLLVCLVGGVGRKGCESMTQLNSMKINKAN